MSNDKFARCGLILPTVSNISEEISFGVNNKFTYIVCPLVHRRFKKEYLVDGLNHQAKPVTRSDLLLSGESWQGYIIGYLSKYCNFDSEDEYVRKNAIACLEEEMRIANHLNLTAFMLPIHSLKMENLSRVLNDFLVHRYGTMNILIRLPICPRNQDFLINNCDPAVDLEEDNMSLEIWKKLRNQCDDNSRMFLALDLSEDLPSEDDLERWFAEPVKCIILPTSLFLTNKAGFPVLSKAHQKVITRFQQLNVDFIVEGANRHQVKGLDKYVEYINHLYKQNQEAFKQNVILKFAKGYEDVLQNPLQPLMDNLESQTYEVFEKDPVKYSQYQKAITHALIDRVPDAEKDSNTQVVMVVGAGRGPLVKCVLEAAKESERKVRVYAVEKNANAIITLLNLKTDVWGDKVQVVATDMREWKAPEQADIIVSELLGSFGDNELSPECLDGAQKFLKTDGISIPYRYRSFIAPVQSYKLISEIKRCTEYEHPYEAPYVVLLRNHCRIAEEKQLFEFTHPNFSTRIDNSRYGKIEFEAKFSATLHGIGGYFDSHLYKDTFISICPSTYSPDMFSWFPIFFPLKDPIDVKKGDVITVHFWRIVTSQIVYYEWCVSSPKTMVIHNPNGRTYSIGLH